MAVEDIKRLREITSLGINECKKALDEAKGDFNKALSIVKQKGTMMMEAKKDRKTSQGLVEAYVHFSGNLGSLVEVNCETDFVARTEGFKKFVKDLAMHVAAAGPRYTNKEDIPVEVLAKEANAEEFIKQSCLMEQSFVKDSSLTIKAYLQQVITQTGENVVIRRFSRFALGMVDL
jgi:elongation factor Ts